MVTSTWRTQGRRGSTLSFTMLVKSDSKLSTFCKTVEFFNPTCYQIVRWHTLKNSRFMYRIYSDTWVKPLCHVVSMLLIWNIFFYWNAIHLFITQFIFIWEWKTGRSKFGMELPFSNLIPVLRVQTCKIELLWIHFLLPRYLLPENVSWKSCVNPNTVFPIHIQPKNEMTK